jgi:hypothetical protein
MTIRHHTFLAVMLAASLGGAGTTHAELKTKGAGKAQTLVREQFPANQQPRYDLFAARCTHCHEMARPISALLTGLTPISGASFDGDGIKKYVIKMMRKPNSGITKDDAKEIIVFLDGARAQAKEK